MTEPEKIVTTIKRCAQFIGEGQQCPCLASYRYTWPGRDEAFICGECVPKLRGLASTMGLHLQVVPLDAC